MRREDRKVVQVNKITHEVLRLVGFRDRKAMGDIVNELVRKEYPKEYEEMKSNTNK